MTRLLPVGVSAIEGEVKKGESVKILNHDSKRIGLGLTQYA